MKPVIFNGLYGSTLIFHLLALSIDSPRWGTISLSLLTIWPLIFFILGTRYTPLIIRILMAAAIVLTLPGMCMIYAGNYKVYTGLTILFLVYLLYIALFLKVRYTNYPLPTCKWAFIFLSGAVALAIFFHILPRLPKPLFTWPLIIFGLTTFIVLQSVLHAFRLKEQPGGWYCLAGIILFIGATFIFSSVKFDWRLYNGLLGALLYGLSQYGLVYGMVLYIWQRQGSPFASRQMGTN